MNWEMMVIEIDGVNMHGRLQAPILPLSGVASPERRRPVHTSICPVGFAPARWPLP